MYRMQHLHSKLFGCGYSLVLWENIEKADFYNLYIFAILCAPLSRFGIFRILAPGEYRLNKDATLREEFNHLLFYRNHFYTLFLFRDENDDSIEISIISIFNVYFDASSKKNALCAYILKCI